MERREKVRHLRRLQVNYWEYGSDKQRVGYTTNISGSGIYVTAGYLVPPGTRLRLQLMSETRHNVMLEGVVVRVKRSMQTLRTSGMAIRFLTIEELMGELVPDLVTSVVGPQPQEQPAMPSSVPSRPQPPVDESRLFRLQFANRQQFLAALQRDLATGGLFIPSDTPAPLNEVITVELSVAEPGTAPVRFQARVVHRIEPSMPDGAGTANLMAGMGVELQNFEQTLTALESLAERFQQTA